MKRLLKIQLTLLLLLSTMVFAHNWRIYDNTPAGATIQSVEDEGKNNAVLFNGAGVKNGYILGGREWENQKWNDTAHKSIQWSMKFDNSYVVYVRVMTTKGARYIYYTKSNTSRGIIKTTSSTYIHLGLGSDSADDTWHTITRDLNADLRTAEPDNTVTVINAILVRGDGMVGDVERVGAISNTTPWHIYDNTPEGATIQSVEVAGKNDAVFFNGAGTKNGYILGGREEESKWNDTTHKSIQWSMKFDHNYYIYVSVMTTDGSRYLSYKRNNTKLGLIEAGSDTYIYFTLGADSADGTWHTITRDLNADLHTVEPNNTITAINAILVRGDGMIADVERVEGQDPEDTTKPVITLNGSPTVTVTVGDTYTDAGAIASDNVDGDITASIVVTGLPVDTATEGNHTITYNVSDAAGNVADVVSRMVKVEAADSCDPVTAITREALITMIKNGDDVTGVNTCAITDMSYLFNLGWNSPYTDEEKNIVKNFNQDISNWDVSKVIYMHYMFNSATAFNQPIGNWDVSKVTSMYRMFRGATAFNQPIGNWNVSNVTDMDGMFSSATAFNQPIGGWDVSKVTHMGAMFYGTETFNQDISEWQTGNVTSMRSMFNSATAFNQPMGGWDVSNVTDMASMFYGAEIFNQDISEWQTGNVTNMRYMFNSATAFNQPIGNWDVSNVTDMAAMFYGTETFNQDISEWQTGNVTNMRYMFNSATAFNQPIGNWDVSNVTDMAAMFYGTETFNQDISEWQTGNVTNMSWMFYDATAFNQDISNWNVTNVTDHSNFEYNSALTDEHNPFMNEAADTTKPVITLNGSPTVTLTVGDTYTDAGATASDNVDGNITGNIIVTGLPVDTSTEGNHTITYNVSDAAGNAAAAVSRTVEVEKAEDSCDPATAITREQLMAMIGNGDDVTGVNTCAITDMSNLFDVGWNSPYTDEEQNIVKNFNQDISNWDVSKVTNMRYMFHSATAFNQPIGNWDVSNVTDMFVMFYGAGAFNQPIGNWDVSNVTDMGGMFRWVSAFNQDISGWQTGNVTDMSYMFDSVYYFNQPIGKWDVSKVENMDWMFMNAEAFSQDISGWKTENVKYMRRMFQNTINFDQDISNWSVANVTDHDGFADDSALTDEHNPFVAHNNTVPVVDENFTITLAEVPNYNADAPIEDQYLAVVNYLRSLKVKCDDPEGREGPVGSDLVWNNILKNASQEHSDDMLANQNMIHEGSNTDTDITGQSFDPSRASTPTERMVHNGYEYYSATGENVATIGSYPTLSEQAWVQAMENWMKSKHGHCSNIMNPSFRDFGMAEARGTKEVTLEDGSIVEMPIAYWTQNFGLEVK